MTNKDQIEGTWRQFKGKIQEKWGKLTDDDLDVIAGKKEQFLGALQKKEGLARGRKPKSSWKNGSVRIPTTASMTDCPSAAGQ